MNLAARTRRVVRSGGPRRAIRWSRGRILPGCAASGNPSGPLLDGERLHAERLAQGGGIRGVPCGLEEGEHTRQLLDRGRETPGQAHHGERWVEHGYPLAPSSRKTAVRLVEGGCVRTGQLVPAGYVLLEGGSGGAGHVARGDPADPTALTAWYEGRGSG